MSLFNFTQTFSHNDWWIGELPIDDSHNDWWIGELPIDDSHDDWWIENPPVDAAVYTTRVSGNNTTTEQGGTALYTFSLSTVPTDNVKLIFTLSDSSEAKLSALELTITPADWNIPHFLTVTGLDDFDNDGDISYVISTRVDSLDFNYGQRSDGTGGVSVNNLQLINLDDGEDKDLTIYGDQPSPTNDILNGFNGKDRIMGLLGRDRLYGGRNHDRLYGGYDDDALWGQDGDDELFGEQDNDTLYGGDGNDYLVGGEGKDLLVGGNGNDFYIIDDTFDTIDDKGASTDIDTVNLRGNITTYVLQNGVENATLATGGGISLTGNQGNNNLTGNGNNNTINGAGGNDNLLAADGNDTVNGGAGNDTVNGGNGNDQIIGADGGGNDLFIGGNGVDSVEYSSVINTSIIVNLSTGKATGTTIGTDTLQTIENVVAGAKDDVIIGSSANNALTGAGGADQLTGGVGADRLTGGAGADQFCYTSTAESTVEINTRDTIVDFNGAAGDRVSLSAIDANSQQAGDQAFKFIGSANFSGVRGELRFANGVLSADVNGDRTGDFAITLTQVTTFNTGWVIL